jgi:hypothetical protein
VSRQGPYVARRLGELERGEGDYTGLKRPSAATVARAREVAVRTFRDSTPAPSVVPDEDGNVLFIWHRNGIEAEIAAGEDCVSVWAHHRDTEAEWWGSLEEHLGCCVRRLLDVLEGPPPAG